MNGESAFKKQRTNATKEMFLVLDTITTMPIGLYTSIELAKAVMTQWKGPYCIARMEMDSSPSRKFENVFERHLNEESEDPTLPIVDHHF